MRSVGGMEAIRDLVSRADSDKEIEVEVDSVDFLRILLGCPVNRIMLDNFRPSDVREAIDTINAYRAEHPDFAPRIEVSGGVNLDNISSETVPLSRQWPGDSGPPVLWQIDVGEGYASPAVLNGCEKPFVFYCLAS